LISRSWNDVSSSHIYKAWKKSSLLECFPSTSIEDIPDETEDNDVENIFDILQTSKEEVQEWLNCDNHLDVCEIMDDQQIIDSIIAPVPEDEESEEENDDDMVEKIISDTAAVEIAEKLLLWLESKKESTPTQIVTLRTVRDLAVKCRNSVLQQKCITDFFLAK
jgi:DNA-directed RNA polymerase specialized sigma subunit